jgi:RNA polymerase sigma-70 factor (ECF subfamily)
MSEAGPIPDDLAEPDGADRRRLLDGYVDAFTRADASALVRLLRADVEMEMPPTPTWFRGRDAVVGFFGERVLAPGRWRMEPTRANGQPAVLIHRLGDDGAHHPYGAQVLTVREGRIARITSFNDPRIVPYFRR